MADLGAGALPVGENDRLVGMLADRDIAVRAVAQGKGAEAAVRDARFPRIGQPSPFARQGRTPPPSRQCDRRPAAAG